MFGDRPAQPADPLRKIDKTDNGFYVTKGYAQATSWNAVSS